jgi:hypothetical protein
VKPGGAVAAAIFDFLATRHYQRNGRHQDLGQIYAPNVDFILRNSDIDP